MNWTPNLGPPQKRSAYHECHFQLQACAHTGATPVLWELGADAAEELGLHIGVPSGKIESGAELLGLPVVVSASREGVHLCSSLELRER